jgi:hypothetical protein
MESSSSSCGDEEGDFSARGYAVEVDEFARDVFLEELDGGEPAAKRQRRALIQAWVEVRPAGQHQVHLRELCDAFWTTQPVEPLVPTRNPFVELQVTLSVDPEYTLVSVDGARAAQRVAAKDFNLAAAAAGLKHRVRGKTKFWTRTSGEELKPSEVSGAPRLRVLCRPAAYFRVLLEYGEEFADQLSDPQAEALARNLLHPLAVAELPEQLRCSTKPRSLPAADWAPVDAVMTAYLARGQVSGFPPVPGLVDDAGDLVLASRLWPMFRQCAGRVELEAVHEAGGAEQMPDSELRRRLQEGGGALRLRGNPARCIVDPSHRETYTGFAYLCRLAAAKVAPWPEDDWRGDIHRALTDPLARALLLTGHYDFFEVDKTDHTWASVSKLLGLSSPPAASKLVLCASAAALRAVEGMSPASARAGRPANIATFTACFCGPKTEVFMILDGTIPRELVAASVGLALKKITILFEPGTPKDKRAL